jgi:dihydroorotase
VGVSPDRVKQKTEICICCFSAKHTIAMDLNVFDDKTAFKTSENNVTLLEQTIDNLKTLQGK